MASKDIAERTRIYEELLKVNVDLDRLVKTADTYLNEPKESDKRMTQELIMRVQSAYQGMEYWKYRELEDAISTFSQLKTAIPSLFDMDEPRGTTRQSAMRARQEDALKQIKRFAERIKSAHSDYSERLGIDKGLI